MLNNDHVHYTVVVPTWFISSNRLHGCIIDLGDVERLNGTNRDSWKVQEVVVEFCVKSCVQM